ncbi:hypothetical protein [Tychonema sp. LEGE 06208]|uniref:hypothetical protein n=1 Tax=Tychonema sp. LEGE 06208 TaxID=1828663 RepID=UPI00187E9064|nr:hypothetical protein [Tychonema sp. LEGE 06208]MBE9163726.1 hypothetical protein [Tychonema sp. LEGE 06208]
MLSIDRTQYNTNYQQSFDISRAIAPKGEESFEQKTIAIFPSRAIAFLSTIS